MRAFRLSASNYRGFGPDDSISIDVQSGFAALTGPNNGGKSTVLRMFVELRDLLGRVLLNERHYERLLEASIPAQVSLPDPAQLFNRARREAVVITLEITDITDLRPEHVVWLQFRCEPGQSEWSLHVGSGSLTPGTPLVKVAHHNDHQVNGFTTPNLSVNLDFRAVKEVAATIASIRYYGAARTIEGPGTNYFDLVTGAAFVGQWNEWAEGTSVENARRTSAVTATLQTIFGFRSLSIIANPNRDAVNVHADGHRYTSRELGSAFHHVFHVLASAAMAKASVILIDEPELSLHPALQPVFVRALASLASENSVIFATHSLGLARAIADRIYICQRSVSGDRRMVPYSSHPDLVEVLGELSYSMMPELGYRMLVLVEGATEVRSFQELLRKWDLEHLVVCVPLGGASMITKARGHELEELKRVAGSALVRAVIDSERTSPGAPLEPARAQFVDDCKRLGIGCHVLERRALENYFPQRAIDDAIRGRRQALGPFDGRGPSSWPKPHNWRVAQCMTVAEVRATDIGTFLDSLARDLGVRLPA